MTITQAVMSHSLLICVDKRERGIAIQTSLEALGYRTIVSHSMYETVRLAAQELPHLIITESLLADGNAGDLYDRLRENKTLCHIPLLACILRKSREELGPLVNRQFAGFVIGRPDPQAISGKIREIFAKKGQPSPFFLPAQSCGVNHLVIAREAKAIAKSQGFLIMSSDSAVDFRSEMHCVLQTESNASAVLSCGVNLWGKDPYLNLFPIDRIEGTDRHWIDALRELAAPQKQKKVAVSLTDKTFAQQWGTLLSGHGYQAVYRETLDAALQEVTKNPKLFDALLHIGIPTSQQADQWRNIIQRNLPDTPTLIVASPPVKAVLPKVVNVPYPCGLGIILHALGAGCHRHETYSKVNKLSDGGTILHYRTRTQFLGLDETGGYLQLESPLPKGAIFKAEHPFFQDYFPNQPLTIRGCEPISGQEDQWQARFEVLTTGESKAKRWEKLLEQLAPDLLAS